MVSNSDFGFGVISTLCFLIDVIKTLTLVGVAQVRWQFDILYQLFGLRQFSTLCAQGARTEAVATAKVLAMAVGVCAPILTSALFA